MADKAFMSFTQNGEQVGLGHSLLVGGDTMEYRALVSDVAKKIIEDYAGSQLAGSAQSVQAALAALNSKLETTTISIGQVASGKSSASITFGAYNTTALIIVAQRPTFYGVYLYTNGYAPIVISKSTSAPSMAVSSDYKTITVGNLDSIGGGKEIFVISTRSKATIA